MFPIAKPHTSSSSKPPHQQRYIPYMPSNNVNNITSASIFISLYTNIPLRA